MRHVDYVEVIQDVRDVHDIRDMDQLRRAESAKNGLKQWWKEATVLYLKLVSNVDLEERRKNWRSYFWGFDLDDFGMIEVWEYQENERAPRRRIGEWSINKADIFDMGQAYRLAVAQRNGEDVTLGSLTPSQASLLMAFISDETLTMPKYERP